MICICSLLLYRAFYLHTQCGAKDSLPQYICSGLWMKLSTFKKSKCYIFESFCYASQELFTISGQPCKTRMPSIGWLNGWTVSVLISRALSHLAQCPSLMHGSGCCFYRMPQMEKSVFPPPISLSEYVLMLKPWEQGSRCLAKHPDAMLSLVECPPPLPPVPDASPWQLLDFMELLRSH